MAHLVCGSHEVGSYGAEHVPLSGRGESSTFNKVTKKINSIRAKMGSTGENEPITYDQFEQRSLNLKKVAQ